MGRAGSEAQVWLMQALHLNDDPHTIEDLLDFWFGAPAANAAEQLEKFRRWYVGGAAQKTFAASLEEQLFVMMPLVHAEDLELQTRAVQLARELYERAPLALREPWQRGCERTQHYRSIIARFGRFPSATSSWAGPRAARSWRSWRKRRSARGRWRRAPRAVATDGLRVMLQ